MAILPRLFHNIKELTSKQLTANSGQDIGVVRLGFGNNDAEDRQAIYPAWFFANTLGQPRSYNPVKLRNLAQSSWVQMVLNTFKKAISTIEWRIVPVDEDDGIDHKEDIKKVTDFLNKINNNNQCVNDINSEVVTDLGELDAGVWNYVYSGDSYDLGDVPVYDAYGRVVKTELGLILKPLGKRTLNQIKSVDSASMLKQVDIHKNLLNYYQYSFKHPRQNPTRFEKEEITYMLMNQKSYSIYGWSVIQSIQQVLELLIQSTRYNKDFFTNNATPNMMIGLKDIPSPKLKKLKRMWKNEYAGKPHEVGFINWSIDKIHKLSDSNRDMEWLDGQKWFFKIVFAAFGVSPTEAGFFENANKSNDEGQARVTVRNAIKPHLELLSRHHTNKSIVEILQKDNPGLKFKFFPKDHTQEKIEHDQHKWEVENGVMTINDYRALQGKEPYEWGDEPFKKPGTETNFNFPGNPGNSPPETEGSEEDEKEEDNPKPDKEEQEKEEDKKKSLFKDLVIEAGDEIVEKSANYGEFLTNLFDDMEKRVLLAVDKIGLDKSYKIDKGFGEFVRNLFNVVNTATFAKHIKKFIKADLITGITSVEAELDVDIGFNKEYQDKLNTLSQMQLSGYTINGKKWAGIRGVSKTIQSKVIMTVQSGIAENKTITEIKDAIKDDFEGFTDWRANMISRTESNNIINEGLLLGYKESGLEGGKILKVAMDNRTSPICRRLHAKYSNNPIPLDEPFVDDKTMKEFMAPSFHPNCRSRVAYRVK